VAWIAVGGAEAMAAAAQPEASSSEVASATTSDTSPISQARRAVIRSWFPSSVMRRISPKGMFRWSMSSGS
jgi:hypothetical protein